MQTKIYWTLWAVFFAAAALAFAAGYMTPLAITAFGFISLGLVFAGMICVLPNIAAHPSEPKVKVKPVAELTYKKVQTNRAGVAMKSA